MYVIVKTETNKIYAQGVDKILAEDIPFEESLTMGNLSPEAGPATHTMVWWTGETLPDYFTIDAAGTLVASTAEAAAAATAQTASTEGMSLVEQVRAGLLVLAPDQKIVDNRIFTKSLKEQIQDGTRLLPEGHKLVEDPVLGYQIVEMTLTEKVRAGLITLTANQKIVQNADGSEQIVTMTLTEQVAAGILTLAAAQKIVTNADGTEQIVTMTLTEQVTARVIELAANQKIVTNADGTEQIVTMTLTEQVAAGVLKLARNEKIVTNADGTEQVVTMTLTEQVAAGVIKLESIQKIVVGADGQEQIVPKSLYEQCTEGLFSIHHPLEYVSADKPDEVQKRTVQEIVDRNLIATVAQGNDVLSDIVTETIRSIEAAYSPGDEMKITKAYLEALGEGAAGQTAASDQDPRVIRFRQMQSTIAAIKAQYAPLKEAVRQRINALEQGTG